MTETTTNTEELDTTSEQPNELETLKARADLMGIKYHPNTGVDKLKAKIDNALGSGEDKPTKSSKEPPIKEFLTQKEFYDLQLKNRRKTAGSLVRVRIVCMNPNKKDWEGEIFSVGSAKLGTFKKYVPFNTEDGWHVPKIMLNMIKERKCAVFTTVKDARGNKVRKAKLVPEFSIEILPPLTKDELKDLAQKQAMSGSIDN